MIRHWSTPRERHEGSRPPSPSELKGSSAKTQDGDAWERIVDSWNGMCRGGGLGLTPPPAPAPTPARGGGDPAVSGDG